MDSPAAVEAAVEAAAVKELAFDFERAKFDIDIMKKLCYYV